MKTNNLKYTETKQINHNGEKCDIIVKIRLNDECKNGHQDFAITGDIYEAGSRSDRACISGGCIHDEILKYFHEFKIFVKLHLSDYSGVPMYAVENGFYHLREGFNNTKPTSKNFKKEFCNYYRMTPKQFDVINESCNKLEYAILLQDLGILDNWREQANQAVKELEKLTGNEFLNDSVKCQYVRPKAEDIEDLFGIPLTDEWLTKFGFISDEISWYYSLDYDKEKETFKIFELQDESGYAILGVNEFSICIKYVHQLQNLYFALANEELKLIKNG